MSPLELLARAQTLEERGDPVAAEALRWALAKGREPSAVHAWYWGRGNRDRPDGIPDAAVLRHIHYSVVDPWADLVAIWRALSPAGRAAFWAWEPN